MIRNILISTLALAGYVLAKDLYTVRLQDFQENLFDQNTDHNDTSAGTFKQRYFTNEAFID